MAERSFPFDSVAGDRIYHAEDMARVLHRLSRTGYVVGEGDELRVTETSPSAMQVQIGTGSAFLNGRYYENSEPLIPPIGAPDAEDRIDRIVVRADMREDARTVRAAVVQGEPAPSPAPPPIERTAQVFEIALAQVRVRPEAVQITQDDITDERHVRAVCGPSVHPSIIDILGSRVVGVWKDNDPNTPLDIDTGVLSPVYDEWQLVGFVRSLNPDTANTIVLQLNGDTSARYDTIRYNRSGINDVTNQPGFTIMTVAPAGLGHFSLRVLGRWGDVDAWPRAATDFASSGSTSRNTMLRGELTVNYRQVDRFRVFSTEQPAIGDVVVLGRYRF